MRRISVLHGYVKVTLSKNVVRTRDLLNAAKPSVRGEVSSQYLEQASKKGWPVSPLYVGIVTAILFVNSSIHSRRCNFNT